ncbi:MAG: hypothetical protein JWO57_789, partial [Pseudonocardiales bacterium]|nr:hypothetical protein [Pseudonocardiales bacterium]
MPEPTTAPVTADGLRERLTEVLNTTLVMSDDSITRATTKWDRHDRHNFLSYCAACRGDVPAMVSAVLAALAGDPGDMPARMAEAMRSHFLSEKSDSWSDGLSDGLTYCVCGETVASWNLHRAQVAMSVRWEDHTATVAERDEQKRRGDQYCAEAAHWAGRVVDREAEVERLRAELASLTESRTFWRKFAAKLEAERDERQDERDNYLDRLRKAEGAYSRLDGQKRDLEGVRDRLRTRCEEAEAERDTAVAAVRTAQITHIREAGHNRPVVGDC